MQPNEKPPDGVASLEVQAARDPTAGGVCCKVSFRAMMCVLMLQACLQSATGGVFTGTLTALEDGFGFSTTGLATILAMYDAGALCTAFPAAHFGTSNLPRWVGGGTLLSVVGLVVYGAASSMWMFCLGQFLCGCGAGAFWVLGVVHIDDQCHDKSLVSTFTGWMMAITPLGVIFGFLLAGFFLVDCGSAGDGSGSAGGCAGSLAAEPVDGPLASPLDGDCSGWRPPFFVLAVMLAGPSIWMFLSRKRYAPPSTAKCCEEKVDAGATPGSPDALHDNQHRGIIQGAKALVGNCRVILLCAGAGLHTFQSASIVAFGPRFMEHQLCTSKTDASLLTGTFIPVISAGVFLGGHIPTCRNWGIGDLRKSIFLIAATTAASLPLTLGSFLAKELWVFLLLVMFGLALQFVMVSPSVTALERAVAEEDRSAAVAAQNVLVRAAGGIPGPIALGALLDAAKSSSEERQAYVVVNIIGVVGAAVFWFWAYCLQRPLDRRDRMEQAHRRRSTIPGQSPRIVTLEFTEQAPNARLSPPGSPLSLSGSAPGTPRELRGIRVRVSESPRQSLASGELPPPEKALACVELPPRETHPVTESGTGTPPCLTAKS
eukprot:Hpha_TRINITY_DN33709_c0_g1::TRINITY_DN33709_c0_g1_i1::g.25144::m.25144